MDYRDYPEYGEYMENYRRGHKFRELEHFFEREKDRYGKLDLVGYKVLMWCGGNEYRSPNQFLSVWKGYRLAADHRPTAYNQYGIYVVKRPEYAQEYMQSLGCKMFLVGMKPRIVEHELGYRAQEAYMIMEIAI